MYRARPTTRRLARGIALVGSLAVALLQLQVALHSHVDHHHIEPAGDVCEVCLKLDSTGSAPPAGSSTTHVPENGTVTLLTDGGVFSSRSPARFAARAPPRA